MSCCFSLCYSFIMVATDKYAAAWSDRRRRMALFRASQFALLAYFAATLLFAVATRRQNPPWVLLIMLPLLVGYVAAGVWLNRFRCPRCGKLYYWSGSFKHPKDWRDCRHCGLKQDAQPELG